MTDITVKKTHTSLNKELIEKLNSFFNNELKIKNEQDAVDVSKILYENFENTEYILYESTKHDIKLKNIVEYNDGNFSINIEDYSFYSKNKERSLSPSYLERFKRK